MDIREVPVKLFQHFADKSVPTEDPKHLATIGVAGYGLRLSETDTGYNLGELNKIVTLSVYRNLYGAKHQAESGLLLTINAGTYFHSTCFEHRASIVQDGIVVSFGSQALELLGTNDYVGIILRLLTDAREMEEICGKNRRCRCAAHKKPIYV